MFGRKSARAALRAVAAGALVGVLALGAADVFATAGTVRAGLLDAAFFRQFDSLRRGARDANADSWIEAHGLWAAVPVQVRLEMAAQRAARRVRTFANGEEVDDRIVELTLSAVEWNARTDAQGRLRIEFAGGNRQETAVRVRALTVRQLERRGPDWPGLLLYAACGAIAAALAHALHRRRAEWLLPALLALAVLAGGRLLVLAYLPGLVLVLGAVLLWLCAARVSAAAAGIDVASGRWISAAVLVRLGFVLLPRFGSIDAAWHAHRLLAFAGGGLILSDAPGVAVNPYPPALYAVLLPFLRLGVPEVPLVRVAIGLLEASAPFLVLALARSLRLPPVAAAYAAVASAVMPEGLLVLAKGIASNILGSWLTVVVVIALVRGARTVIVAGLLALLFLAHAPAAVTGLCLVGAWTLLEWREGSWSRARVARLGACVAGAALVAWLAYYREARLAFESVQGGPPLLGIRWYRVVKLFQDLVLKFGLGPVALAVVGWRARRAADPALRRLATAWLAVAALFGALALGSRFPLRFEYFALPALALLAGLGAARVPARLRVAAWALALAVQVVLGVLWTTGHFDVIAVIMESPRFTAAR